jgi:hypothetical protein
MEWVLSKTETAESRRQMQNMTSPKSSVATQPSPDSTVATQEGYRRACDECGGMYKPGKSWGKFCSDDCRWQAWKQSHIRVKKSTVDRLFGAGAAEKLVEADKKNETGVDKL